MYKIHQNAISHIILPILHEDMHYIIIIIVNRIGITSIKQGKLSIILSIIILTNIDPLTIRKPYIYLASCKIIIIL